jgi:hypothetical protein
MSKTRPDFSEYWFDRKRGWHAIPPRSNFGFFAELFEIECSLDDMDPMWIRQGPSN